MLFFWNYVQVITNFLLKNVLNLVVLILHHLENLYRVYYFLSPVSWN